jgi:hypothetical protein
MKSLNRVLHGGLLLCAALLLFSCKKQIAEPKAKENDVIASASSASAACKPAILGCLSLAPSTGQTFWTTIYQRWYDGQGKLSNFKANISQNHETVFVPAFKIDWGTVSYHGNQVYVHDNGKLVLRVTMNAQQRPEASYFYGNTPGTGYSEVDTTYYFYTGDRLTQYYSIKSVLNSAPRGTMYNLAYDSYGNIIKIFTGNSNGSYQAHFKYNYNKPTNGMMGYYITQLSFQVMEYTGLINLPMQHELVQFYAGSYQPGSTLYPYETFPVWVWDYTDHVQSGGFVSSYQSTAASFRHTFYTGWDCGSSPAAGAVNREASKPIQSFEDFKQRFQ